MGILDKAERGQQKPHTIYGEVNMATASGTLMWVSISSPNTNFDPCWTVNLIPDDPDILEEFRSRGHSIKTDDQGREAVVIKRKCTWPSGDTKERPRLVDTGKNPIDVPVGNNSRGIVQYSEYVSTYKNKEYPGLDLKALMVTDLIEYEAGDGDELEAIVEDDEF